MKLPRDLTLHSGADLRIGAFIVNAGAQRLLRETDRSPLALERSSFDLLLALALQPGEVLAKDALLRAVWPGRVVSENSLTQAVHKLRAALGDADGSAIQLVRGFGYRLALPVTQLPSDPLSPAAQTPDAQIDAASIPGSTPTAPARVRAFWAGALAALLLGGASAVVIAWRDEPAGATAATTDRRLVRESRNTLAVLPFEDRSSDGSLAREALLLADGLRRDAHRLPQMHAAAESAVRAYSDSPDDPEAVLAALDADLVLTGSVWPHLTGVEVVLRLLDHSGQGLAFERRYQHPRAALGELQTRLRFELYEHLGDTAGRWQHDPAQGRGTPNREARLAFLRAAALLGDDEEGQRRAKDALAQAVALDPNYADAWIALGSVLGAGGGTGGLYADNSDELAEGRLRALAALDRGISLAPNQAGHYLLRSEIRHIYFHDWDGAEADLARAESLLSQPSSHFLIQRARMAAARGELREAVAFDERASAVDPASGSKRNQGWHLIALGEYAQARTLLLQELAVRPFESSLNFYLGLCDVFEGLPEAALARFEQASTVHRLTGSVVAHAARDDRAAAERALASLEQRFADTAAYEIAIGHAWLGRPNMAFEWLDRAIRVGDGGVSYLAFDPLLQALRSDPRYPEMLRRIRHPSVKPA